MGSLAPGRERHQGIDPLGLLTGGGAGPAGVVLIYAAPSFLTVLDVPQPLQRLRVHHFTSFHISFSVAQCFSRYALTAGSSSGSTRIEWLNGSAFR